MDNRIAFAAREDAEGFTGSVSFGSEGESINVAEELEAGDGVIVVEEGSPRAIALATYPALKRVTVPAAKVAAAAGVDATEAAISKAEELDVDLSEVEGSGADGRVTVDDVKAAADTEEA